MPEPMTKSLKRVPLEFHDYFTPCETRATFTARRAAVGLPESYEEGQRLKRPHFAQNPLKTCNSFHNNVGSHARVDFGGANANHVERAGSPSRSKCLNEEKEEEKKDGAP
jgi:hypothetical protein